LARERNRKSTCGVIRRRQWMPGEPPVHAKQGMVPPTRIERATRVWKTIRVFYVQSLPCITVPPAVHASR
jgi:hypothetical protein